MEILKWLYFNMFTIRFPCELSSVVRRSSLCNNLRVCIKCQKKYQMTSGRCQVSPILKICMQIRSWATNQCFVYIHYYENRYQPTVRRFLIPLCRRLIFRDFKWIYVLYKAGTRTIYQNCDFWFETNLTWAENFIRLICNMKVLLCFLIALAVTKCDSYMEAFDNDLWKFIPKWVHSNIIIELL